MARESAAVATRPTATAEARLALVEELQVCTDTATAAERTTEWLVAHSAAERAIYTAPDVVRNALVCVAGTGISPRQSKKFCPSLDDLTHPLVSALTNGAVVSFHNARNSRVPLFGDAPFTAIKVGGNDDDPAFGLMLISPATDALGRPGGLARRAGPLPAAV